MAHYVLMFRGGEPREADLELIEQAADVTILDHSAARALLVDAPEHAAKRLREQLQDWLVAAEVTYAPPGPAQQTLRDDLPQGPE
jgi:hypothetical protein